MNLSFPSPKQRAEEISVKGFFEAFKDITDLKIIAGEKGMDRVISEPSINRPALAITGYFKNFASKRIQLFGAGEMSYMRDLRRRARRRFWSRWRI